MIRFLLLRVASWPFPAAAGGTAELFDFNSFTEGGFTVLTACDAGCNAMGADTPCLSSASLRTEGLRVYAPGIRKATLRANGTDMRPGSPWQPVS